MDTSLSISGPEFLGLYMGWAFFITVVYFVWRIVARFQGGRMPETNLLDPLAIAYLRGGVRAVAETVVTGLVAQNKMAIESLTPGYVLRDVNFLASGQGAASGSRLENIVAQALVNTDLSLTLARNMPEALVNQIEHEMEGPKKALRECGLLKPEGYRLKLLLIHLGISALILLPGIIRLVLGIMADRAVGYLVVLIIVFSLAALISIFVPLASKPYTAKGRNFIRQNGQVFTPEYKKVLAQESPQADPALLAALFGLGVLGVAYLPLGNIVSTTIGALPFGFSGGRGGGGGIGGWSSSGCSCSGCSSSGCSSSSCSSGCSSGCGGGCGG